MAGNVDIAISKQNNNKANQLTVLNNQEVLINWISGNKIIGNVYNIESRNLGEDLLMKS